jgi:uncharacterized protein YicC (UPF0701 family)
MIQLKKGVPTDAAKVDEYLKSVNTTNDLLIQWLEDFKSKFDEYLDTEAKPTVTQVEAALQLYNEVVGAARIRTAVQKAIEAKREQGSVLEYGLNWHLEKFNNEVKISSHDMIY